MQVIEGEENIKLYRLITLKSALSLEIKGMKRRGRSVYSIIKDELGFKGSKQKVFDQLEKHIEQIKESRNVGSDDTQTVS